MAYRISGKFSDKLFNDILNGLKTINKGLQDQKIENDEDKKNAEENSYKGLTQIIAGSVNTFVEQAIEEAFQKATIQGSQFTVAAGIPTAGSPSAQITTAPGNVVGVGKITL